MDSRPATRNDLDAVLDLFCRYETRYRGAPDSEASDLLEDWDRPDWDFARSSLLLHDHGRPLGYAGVAQEYTETVVDPDLDDRTAAALSDQLLTWVEDRPDALEHYVPDGDPAMGARLEARGWLPARRFWRMLRVHDDGVPPARWPSGVSVRDYDRPADDRAVHALITRAFGEIGGQHERTLEEWSRFLLETDRFDPALYLVATAGGDVVGACLSQVAGEQGFVRQLAVAPSHRGRGLALALLHDAFARHVARGLPETILGVDAGNPTGALALYEKAGMRVHEQLTRWDRPAQQP